MDHDDSEEDRYHLIENEVSAIVMYSLPFFVYCCHHVLLVVYTGMIGSA